MSAGQHSSGRMKTTTGAADEDHRPQHVGGIGGRRFGRDAVSRIGTTA